MKDIVVFRMGKCKTRTIFSIVFKHKSGSHYTEKNVKLSFFSKGGCWTSHAVFFRQRFSGYHYESDMPSYKLRIWQAVLQTENLTCRLSNCESDMPSYKLRIWHAVFQTVNLTCRLTNWESDMSSYKERIWHAVLQTENPTCRLTNWESDMSSFKQESFKITFTVPLSFIWIIRVNIR